MDAPIFVVVGSEDNAPQRRQPGRKVNLIVFETSVGGATLEGAQARAARLESLGYGPCRIARLVFLDEEAAEAATVLHVGGPAATSTTT